MTHRMFRPALAPMLALVLAGCATYRAMPLSERPNLASSIADLNRTIPASAGGAAQIMPVDQPLTIDQIGILAILNDPDLASENAKLENARGSMITATTLPNPQVSLGFMALLGGPGATTPSYAAGLTQDIMALITYRSHAKAGKDSFASVNASLLWQEWQIAEKARLLALTVYSDERQIEFRSHQLSLLTNELGGVQQQAQAGNLDLTAEAPLTTAVATAQSAYATAEVARLNDWQALNALLGLEPNVRFAIAEPQVVPLPSNIPELLATLPQRRPDLIALQLGYSAQEATLRSAVLLQFPSLLISPNWGQDTSNVKSFGPTATFDLPIFNRNQGGIASAKATREQLYAEYQAQLDLSTSSVEALQTRIAVLQKDYRDSANAVGGATSAANDAQNAYSQSSIDQRSLVDYQTTVLDRELDAVSFKTQLLSDEVTLGAELGVGLPNTLLAARPIPPASTMHHDQVTPQ